MAQFEKMIPFILHCEEGIAVNKLYKEPEDIYALVGNTVHIDPNDSGGYTKAGVILSTYQAYRTTHGIKTTTVEDLRRMPYGEWRAILKRMFWDRWRADEIETPMVAIACVDWMWGSGLTAIKKVQGLLGVTADGVVGPITLAAINNYPDQHALFDKIQAARNAFHYNLCYRGTNCTLPTKNAKFFHGWNRRVAMITWQGFNYNAKG